MMRAKRATFTFLSGQKFSKNAKNVEFWRFLENLCDFLDDFQFFYCTYKMTKNAFFSTPFRNPPFEVPK